MPSPLLPPLSRFAAGDRPVARRTWLVAIRSRIGSLRFRLTVWNTVVVLGASLAALLALREGARYTLQQEADILLREETLELSLAELSYFVDDTLTRRFMAVSGVSKVVRLGGADREINVVLDASRLEALGVTAPEINIALRRHGPVAELTVSDTGIGIPPEHLTHIFERFYRVDTSRSRELGGTGLGLSIVRQIAETHGGQVRVRSTVGEGSTFTVALPVALANGQPVSH